MNREIKEGTKVHYDPKFGDKENGIVKEVRDGLAFVVYKCNNDWSKYKNYTGQSTQLTDLKYGWVDENGNLMKEFCDHYYIPTNAKWQPENQRQSQFCGDIIN